MYAQYKLPPDAPARSAEDLAIAVVLAAHHDGLPAPGAMFAVSPWTDLTLDSPALRSHAERDMMVRMADLEMMRTSYLGDGGEHDLHARTISPALADLGALPPLLVQVGAEEILIGDSELLVERARAAGVDATLQVAEGMFHTWAVIAPQLPESRNAIAALASFIYSI